MSERFVSSHRASEWASAKLMVTASGALYSESEAWSPRRLLAGIMDSGPAAISGSIFQLNSLLISGQPDLAAIARIIGADPSLAAQVLRHTNRNIGAGELPVFDIAEAVRYAGIEFLKCLVLMCPIFDHCCGPQQWRDIQTMWQRGVLIGYFAKIIAHASGFPEPEHAYTAGLLHGIDQIAVLGLDSCGAAGLSRRELDSWMAAAPVFPPTLISIWPNQSKLTSHFPVLIGLANAAAKLCELGAKREVRCFTLPAPSRILEVLRVSLPHLCERELAIVAHALNLGFPNLQIAVEFTPAGVLQAALESPDVSGTGNDLSPEWKS